MRENLTKLPAQGTSSLRQIVPLCQAKSAQCGLTWALTSSQWHGEHTSTVLRSVSQRRGRLYTGCKSNLKATSHQHLFPFLPLPPDQSCGAKRNEARMGSRASRAGPRSPEYQGSRPSYKSAITVSFYTGVGDLNLGPFMFAHQKPHSSP